MTNRWNFYIGLMLVCLWMVATQSLWQHLCLMRYCDVIQFICYNRLACSWVQTPLVQFVTERPINYYCKHELQGQPTTSTNVLYEAEKFHWSTVVSQKRHKILLRNFVRLFTWVVCNSPINSTNFCWFINRSTNSTDIQSMIFAGRLVFKYCTQWK